MSYKNGKSLFVYDQGNGMICVDRDACTGDENMTYKTVNESNSGSLMVDCYMQDSMGNRYFTDFNNNLICVREFIMLLPHIYTELGIPQIKWKISKEQKTIGNYVCTKASTKFRGREYTAWFSPKLPAKIGPWKLTGLPGTILEAADSQNLISFKAVAINFTNNEYLNQENPNKWKGERISFEKAKTLPHELRKKLAIKYNSSMDRGSTTDINSINLNTLEIYK
ncbi:MAG: GLPGLI family protein [Saprospiraceae bacterium]|nr:GLPGLI family protein [Saprospiraceae bacterium]